MEQFASSNPNIKVVGIGILDSLGLAEDFNEVTGASNATMLWSESSELWDHYSVSSQHTTILLDGAGQEIERWNDFDAQDVSSAAS